MNFKRKTILGLVLLILLTAFAMYLIRRKSSSCEGVACAPGDNCVAANDALVKCTELQKNPTKTDY